ncbi:MAG: ATP-binding cassette domain-containing protein [Oscillospiraceae bacterium]|jgi:putative ABC transport system permease protein|nr:ATP-binding cassette domain-containing protein [Oscillospiraceae bacterium]
MLQLKNIRKTYKVYDIETKALDDVSVAFREKEFVAILGPSGSGKTTCLNIIGGLDRYDSGEMTIKGKSTRQFKEKDWDAYRNNSIGFVFQNYNLIGHLSIVANVEMAMTLSGISRKKKRKRAKEVLEQVGLKDHMRKKPSQLSGGQMQRVAIARALANDPEILLCDEPTGALDTATSIQILDLIRDLSQERLVIMVTHNPELANQYADRIVKFQDGKIISDTNPFKGWETSDNFTLKKTKMSYFTALSLSFNNIRTKKGRTFLTSFASSIGIIGIAIILSLSSGFQVQIDKFQSDAMAEFPIIISPQSMDMSAENLEAMQNRLHGEGNEKYPDAKEVYLNNPMDSAMMHKNKIDSKYINYIEKIDPKICNNIGYTRLVNLNLVRKLNNYIPVSLTALGESTGGMQTGVSSFPINVDKSGTPYIEKNYDLLSGTYPQKDTDLVLVVDERNRVDTTSLEKLGFDANKKSFRFNQIVGTEFKLIPNNEYYTKIPEIGFMPNQDYKEMYESRNAKTLTITGIIRLKEEVKVGVLNTGVAYSDSLSKSILKETMSSDIVRAQRSSSTNVMTGQPFDNDAAKEMFLQYLGGSEIPAAMLLYPKDFDSKDKITAYLDAYNEGKKTADKVIYNDMAATISNMTSGIMSGITNVLIAFASVSLVVSLIMICIITYISVLERRKEIGVLKALGARKKDITRVFDAETTIIGVFAGLIGILIAWLCTFPINVLLANLTSLENVAVLKLSTALILVLISTVLTILGGHIPARMASKKDAVEALRSE